MPRAAKTSSGAGRKTLSPMRPMNPITPQDLITVGLLALAVGIALGYVAAEFTAHLRAHLRARKMRALLERSTIFKFRA